MKNIQGIKQIFNNLDKQNKFFDTAALITNLDLIISIDTSIALLSAAMQKKTWVSDNFGESWPLRTI